ncbi:MAG: RloB family protein [Flavobacteriales bacterium]|jgi:hypothetical protein|nr:RloB family protein [Flavobacteriales bacterium]
MARKKNKARSMNPTYFVFCEGDTEKEYIKILKKQFRHIPIEIKEKIEGNQINTRKVVDIIQEKGLYLKNKDKVFLLYDIDVPKMLEKLLKVKDAILLVSNPCIEFWFLLHCEAQNAHISTSNAIKKLEKNWKNYKKGKLTEQMAKILQNNQKQAILKAKKLKAHSNPSSTIYRIIEILSEKRISTN